MVDRCTPSVQRLNHNTRQTATMVNINKMTLSDVALLLCIIQGMVISCATENSPVVHLGDNASVRGFVTYTHSSTKPVYTFTGMPFAEKPVRFLPAEPLKLWDGEKDATKTGNVCVQAIEIMTSINPDLDAQKLSLSEDCLFLNIWTPSLKVDSKLDVMVWIHGGAFLAGTGSGYEGTALATFHDVVFVSFNYRVDGLGFLTTGDRNAPGNIGILDQIEALLWVQKYIHKFGGDPEKVTIFGESAGSMSVSLHLVSPLSRHLFKRAISQSGVAQLLASQPAETSQSGLSKTKEVAKREGCPLEDNKSMVECLRGKPAESFFYMGGIDRIMKDGHLLPDSPYNLYSMGQINAKDYMLGFNAVEAYNSPKGLALLSGNMSVNIAYWNLTREEVRTAFKVATFADYAGDSKILDILMEKYVGQKKEHEELYRALVECFGDYLMNHRILDVARKHSVKKTTFVYFFNHRLGIIDSNRPEWVTADHMDDVFPSLGYPFFDQMVNLPFFSNGTYTDEDRKISKLMMSYWTNFAKTGNPNGQGLPRWPRYGCKTKRYMELRSNPHETADYRPEWMNLWIDEIPELDKTKSYKGFPWKCPADEKEEL